MTYSTNGRLFDSAQQMMDVSGKTCRYLYAKIGLIRDVYTPKEGVFETNNEIKVFLPDEYDITVNDNFQLFYRGVVQAVNPYNYSITVTCSKGNSYPRYYEWTPSENDIGSYKLNLTVYDDNGKVLGYDTTTLNVHSPKQTNEIKNVLCIGDSLTAGGYWVREAQRRFTENGGTPEGLNLDYLNFIGTNKKTINGKTVGFEGYGGWTWERYCGSTSPFYDEELGDISFSSYCEKNGFDGIDVVYILLTWNGQGTPYKTDYAVDKGHFVYAKKLIDRLHEDYPEAIVRCMGIQMPSQNGGMGENYGAYGGYSDDYGMLVTAMNYNAALEDFCQLPEYKDFVKYVDIAGQFDTDYNMPSTDKPVNNRNDITETVGTNGVHPSVNGYYQIADAVFRSLCEVFSQ
jgi:lysophospholipase L1-like esterase